VVEIAQIREEHIESFHATLDVVCRERVYLAMLEAPPIDTTRQFLRRSIAKGYPQRVALDGDRVIGWCDVTPPDRPIMQHLGVLGMGLLPQWRGQGLGRRLMQEALDASHAFGFARVELNVRDDNSRAIALYRRLGFVVEGTKRRAILVDDTYHNLVMMALLFDAPHDVSDSAGRTT
jgi:ribosomal protein S18 acetylase RimI-like enzyme